MTAITLDQANRIIAAILKRGAEKAQEVAGATLAKAKEAIGLLPRA